MLPMHTCIYTSYRLTLWPVYSILQLLATAIDYHPPLYATAQIICGHRHHAKKDELETVVPN